MLFCTKPVKVGTRGPEPLPLMMRDFYEALASLVKTLS